ncbi:MAG TPA: alanine racemase [Gaiellales bacterium]|jgi:D-serine deaminase-like pyridoxal phosphate-dependent protein
MTETWGPAPGMPLADVPTPSLVIDLRRMERNIAAWQAMADRNGVRLRPHIKTHKTPAIARMQLDAGACGIASAKPSEAEVFAASGCDDIVIAYPTVGAEKWARLARLARTARLTVNVDSDHQVRGLSAAAVAEGVEIRVQIEIDTGLHRVGVAPADYASLVAFARVIAALPAIELDGITTHRGKPDERVAAMTNIEAGHEEGRILVDLAERLAADGLPVANVTAGGSVTGPGVAEVPGVTEVRAGTYVFYDAMQVGYGSATPADVALSVLATVISTRRAGWTTVDAGSKTFSGDRGGVPGAGGDEIAVAVDLDAAVMRTTEEHGMVRLGPGASVEVGQKLQFTPYHVCTAVNLANELVGVRDGVVETVWPIAARGQTR